MRSFQPYSAEQETLVKTLMTRIQEKYNNGGKEEDGEGSVQQTAVPEDGNAETQNILAYLMYPVLVDSPAYNSLNTKMYILR